MRSLNLDQLRTLVEVVARGNFSAAARQLNLTQPAISLHIRELEQRYGVRLVERMGRCAQATAPGRELVARASRIFEECAAADDMMRRFREGWIGAVHIGTTLTALTYELPPILRKLHCDHPGIDLRVTNLSTRDSVDGILNNAIDLALVTLPVKEPRLCITPLRPETLVAIFPAAMPNIPDEVTPDYVVRQSLVLEHARGAVHALVMQWLSKHLPLQRAPMHLGTVEAMKRVVASHLGMSIVPDVAVTEPAPDIVVRPLNPPVPCTLALIEHRNKPNETALEIVRNALIELKTDREAVPARSNAPPRMPTPTSRGDLILERAAG